MWEDFELTVCRERIVLPMWRSMASVNLMLPKEDRKAMLLRVYNDDSPLVDHSQQKRIAQALAASEDATETETPAADDEVKEEDDIKAEDADVPMGENGTATQGDAEATELTEAAPEGEDN